MKVSNLIRVMIVIGALAAATGTTRAQINPEISATVQAISGLSGEEEAEAAALITAALNEQGVPVLTLVRDASAANPSLAPTVAATAAGLFPDLSVFIGRAAARGAPSQSREIATSVAVTDPDNREEIFDAINRAIFNAFQDIRNNVGDGDLRDEVRDEIRDLRGDIREIISPEN
jgi:ABC-type uncharacterized transport system substrate-binding protein